MIPKRLSRSELGSQNVPCVYQVIQAPTSGCEMLADDLAHWRAEISDKVTAFAEALGGPTTPPGKRVQLLNLNPPGSEVGPGDGVTHLGEGQRQSRGQLRLRERRLLLPAPRQLRPTLWRPGQVVESPPNKPTSPTATDHSSRDSVCGRGDSNLRSSPDNGCLNCRELACNPRRRAGFVRASYL